MERKKIIHFIPSLGRGGAETMLVHVVSALTEYDHVIVTLDPANHFGPGEINATSICLNLPSVWRYPQAILRFRKLVRAHRPAIVHTHLYWPTVIARLAVPRGVPLISTLHAFIAEAPEYRKSFIRLLDRFSFRKRPSVLLSVAEGALEEYVSLLRIKPAEAHVLHTFVDSSFIDTNRVSHPQERNRFTLVSVGALRQQKNHSLLLNALHRLRNEAVSLDIYGSGPLRHTLEIQLERFPARVHLKGENRKIRMELPRYDLFVMSSDYEGFSIAVLEAMALRIPLLLSDIPSFREQCGDTAVYFEKGNDADCAQKILALSGDAALLKKNSEAAYRRVKERYTLEQHLSGIRLVYTGCLRRANNT
jgi:glycosyltransferase involved in cell wall biosynthesis